MMIKNKIRITRGSRHERFAVRTKENAPAFTGASRFESIGSVVRLVALEATLPAATTTTTSAAAAASSATTAEGTARAAFFTGTCFVDGQGATMEVFAVEQLDGLLGFIGGAHGDEGKSAGLAGHAILHQSGFRNGAGLGEEILEFDFESLKGEIPDV